MAYPKPKLNDIGEDRLDFWSPSHYMDVGTDERNRGDMETFVGDQLLSKQQREQIAKYARGKGAATA